MGRGLCRVTGGEAATRTLYCQYNVPVKVGMSLSFLASACKMSERQSRREGSVTKVVTIENHLGDQLTVTH